MESSKYFNMPYTSMVLEFFNDTIDEYHRRRKRDIIRKFVENFLEYKSYDDSGVEKKRWFVKKDRAFADRLAEYCSFAKIEIRYRWRRSDSPASISEEDEYRCRQILLGLASTKLPTG